MSTNGKENPVIILVIVLVLVILALWIKGNGEVPVDDTSVLPTVDVTPNYVNPNAPISYANALIKYRDARIQLGEDCQATPSYATYKNGTSIMVDNRSASARTVKVGSTYVIRAYGFQIVKLSSPILPIKWFVDCGKSQNVATVLIQK